MNGNKPNRGRPEEEVASSLEHAATEWFFRRDAGLTQAEAEAFRGWLSQEAHARAFAEIENTWQALGDARESVTDARRGARSAAVRPRGIRWLQMTIAAAAVLALSSVIWWRAARPETAFTRQVATRDEKLRRMDLPDGSAVILNQDSAIDVKFSAAVRHVRLVRGEAHFAVFKDAGRPFVVEGRGVAVQAVGTTFNVRLGTESVEVIVTAGKVRVDTAVGGTSLVAARPPSEGEQPIASDEKSLVVAGEKIVIPSRRDAAPEPAVAATLAAEEIDRALVWQKHRLEYVDAALSQIVADFNRHNQHRLVIADAELGERRFGGSFPAGDYDSLVQLLETTFGIRTERRQGETVLRLP